MAEALDAEILDRLGITPAEAFSVNTLIKFREEYVKAIDAAKESISASDDTIKEVSTSLSSDKGLSTLKEMFKSQTLTLIYDYLLETSDRETKEVNVEFQGDMRFSVLMYELLSKEILPIVKYERDTYIAAEKRRNNPTKEVDTSTFDEKVKEAEELGKAIRVLFEGIMTMFPALLQDGPLQPKKIEGFPMVVPKPKEYKSGKISKVSIVPDLPKVPWITKEDSKATGRPVLGSHMELFWNGEKVFPSDFCSTPTDVVNKLVSDRQNGRHYTWRGILDAVKESGKNIMKDDWKMELPTGILEGKVSKDS